MPRGRYDSYLANAHLRPQAEDQQRSNQDRSCGSWFVHRGHGRRPVACTGDTSGSLGCGLASPAMRLNVSRRDFLAAARPLVDNRAKHAGGQWAEQSKELA
jgi:hypothetical protein